MTSIIMRIMKPAGTTTLLLHTVPIALIGKPKINPMKKVYLMKVMYFTQYSFSMAFYTVKRCRENFEKHIAVAIFEKKMP